MHLLLFSDFQENLFQLGLPCVLLRCLYQLLTRPNGCMEQPLTERQDFLQAHEENGVLALMIALSLSSKCISILQTSHKTLE